MQPLHFCELHGSYTVPHSSTPLIRAQNWVVFQTTQCQQNALANQQLSPQKRKYPTCAPTRKPTTFPARQTIPCMPTNPFPRFTTNRPRLALPQAHTSNSFVLQYESKKTQIQNATNWNVHRFHPSDKPPEPVRIKRSRVDPHVFQEESSHKLLPVGLQAVRVETHGNGNTVGGKVLHPRAREMIGQILQWTIASSIVPCDVCHTREHCKPSIGDLLHKYEMFCW